MRMVPDASALRDESRAGFTFTELLVILAVLVILAAIQVSAFSAGKDQSRIAQCAGNLKQFALALQIYGGESKDKLPPNTAGFWTWDMAWNTGNLITQWIPFERLYCPGTSVRFTGEDNESLWEYYAPGNIHVIGYAPTLPGTPSLMATNVNSTLTPQRIQLGGIGLPAPSPARRVLIADATLAHSANNYSARYTYEWVNVFGGFPKAHISPHLNGRFPAGRNAAMLDGHVDWAPFDSMQPRTTSDPYFWW
jgi:prepilin-type processing-associated H-X9-DG protein